MESSVSSSAPSLSSRNGSQSLSRMSRPLGLRRAKWCTLLMKSCRRGRGVKLWQLSLWPVESLMNKYAPWELSFGLRAMAPVDHS